MKKIINGKVYDTEKATMLNYWENSFSGRDFGWCREELYRKKTGEFFLHGEGGPQSRYSVSQGNNTWSGGERVMPLSYDAAKQWAEEHLDGDEYEAIFGEVVEDDSKTPLNLTVSKTAVEIGRREAAKRGESLSALVEELLSAFSE